MQLGSTKKLELRANLKNVSKTKKIHMYYDEAEALFVAFAQKHDLNFIKEITADGDIFLVFPEQDGLRFRLTLGIQNGDEANIGINDFWSYIFPYPDNVEFLNETLDGLFGGTHTLAEYKQFNRVTKLCLLNSQDEIIYTDVKRIKLPFFDQRITNITTNKERVKS